MIHFQNGAPLHRPGIRMPRAYLVVTNGRVYVFREFLARSMSFLPLLLTPLK